MCARELQAAADDNVPTAFVILVKAPEPDFIAAVTNELAGIKDAGTAAVKGRNATEYVSCVEQMTAMYSKANGHASLSKVLGAIGGATHGCWPNWLSHDDLQGHDAHIYPPLTRTGWSQRLGARSQTRRPSSRTNSSSTPSTRSSSAWCARSAGARSTTAHTM